jgi:hypothetical protein
MNTRPKPLHETAQWRLWESPTVNQALANQRGPKQFQHPLVRAPLATTYKDADLQPASRQSQLGTNRSVIRFPPFR